MPKKPPKPNDEQFSPEETALRFEALLTACLHTKPVSQRELIEANRRGELPHIHELSTVEMWRRAAMRVKEHYGRGPRKRRKSKP